MNQDSIVFFFDLYQKNQKLAYRFEHTLNESCIRHQREKTLIKCYKK